ncbi:MAG: hypothetical protein J0H74_22430 [Chitinophagaceae bacterium]|nr:hypothetical protein [Chitinophagaceae bacterium]
MKRSKIFLGITTVVFAIASVATAKYINTTFTRFYVTFGGSACHPLPSAGVQNSGTLTCLGIYTDGFGNLKSGALFTQGGSATTIVPAFKCKTKVVWDGHSQSTL